MRERWGERGALSFGSALTPPLTASSYAISDAACLSCRRPHPPLSQHTSPMGASSSSLADVRKWDDFYLKVGRGKVNVNAADKVSHGAIVAIGGGDRSLFDATSVRP
eukprot:scaffold56988_cov32-Tisochrysis_lutea.AAC.7